MTTILDLVVKHNALTQEEILDFQQMCGTFIGNLLKSVNRYPRLFTVLEEYYKNNPKEINNIGTFKCRLTPLSYATCSKEMVKFLVDNGGNYKPSRSTWFYCFTLCCLQ